MKKLLILLVAFCGFSCLFGAENTEKVSAEELFKNFVQEYKNFEKKWRQETFSSHSPDPRSVKSFWELEKDLQTTLPIIIQTMKQKRDADDIPGNYVLAIALLDRTLKIEFEEGSCESDPEKILLLDYNISCKSYYALENKKDYVSQLEVWWDHGRQLTPQVFAKKYADYQAAKKSGNEKDIKAKYTLLQNMGVIILPDLLAKIEAGETDLIPMFSELGDQKDLKTAAVCRAWWEANKKRYEFILDYKKDSKEKK